MGAWLGGGAACQRWPRARLQGCCEASKPSTSHLWARRRSWHLGARPGVAGGSTLVPASALPSPRGRSGAPSQRSCHLLGCGVVAAAGSQGRELLLSPTLAGQLGLCLFVSLWLSSFPIKAGKSLPNQLGSSAANSRFAGRPRREELGVGGRGGRACGRSGGRKGKIPGEEGWMSPLHISFSWQTPKSALSPWPKPATGQGRAALGHRGRAEQVG